MPVCARVAVPAPGMDSAGTWYVELVLTPHDSRDSGDSPENGPITVSLTGAATDFAFDGSNVSWQDVRMTCRRKRNIMQEREEDMQTVCLRSDGVSWNWRLGMLSGRS